MDFSSDTSAPAHPRILAALSEANVGQASSYGGDKWFDRARSMLAEQFETDLDVWFVASGTAANALGISTVCAPTLSVWCHTDAHIERDERGAVEFYSGGARLFLLPGEHGRIDPVALQANLAMNRPEFVHETPIGMLSVSNLTESGAAYSPSDLAGLCAAARQHRAAVHLDGARFGNAMTFLGASASALSWRAGVDVMSLGFTKTGALGCEAVILFGAVRDKANDLRVRAKRAGLMPPKMRYLAAQACAALDDGLWLDLARSANNSAAALAKVFGAVGASLNHPVEGNEVFVTLSDDQARALHAAGAVFYEWPAGGYRFVCSWMTSEDEISNVEKTLKRG